MADRQVQERNLVNCHRNLSSDERGSIIARTSSSGALVAANTYDEYGIPGSANAGLFQYTGQAYIPQIGLYYYKARIYSPTYGRFMQTDPIGYDDGANWYNYVGGDPINLIDPLGLQDRTACQVRPSNSRDWTPKSMLHVGLMLTIDIRFR